MRPQSPYPTDDDAPAGPAWARLLPGQREVVDESTTEVPVLPPAAETGAGTDAVEAEAVEATPAEDESAEDAVEVRQVAPVADEARPEEFGAGTVTGVEEVEDPRPPLRPGDVEEHPIAVWSGDSTQQVRDRWRDLQVQFFDDPQAAVQGARGLVTEVVRTLSDQLLAERDEFDPHRDTDRPDTETMRVAMRRYREFLDRILAL
jgi:hypothetical protein